MVPGELEPKILRHGWQDINGPRRNAVNYALSLIGRLDEQRHEPYVVGIFIGDCAARRLGLEGRAVIRGHHHNGLVQNPHAQQSVKHFTDHAVHDLNLQEVSLMALIGKDRIEPDLFGIPAGEFHAIVVLTT